MFNPSISTRNKLLQMTRDGHLDLKWLKLGSDELEELLTIEEIKSVNFTGCALSSEEAYRFLEERPDILKIDFSKNPGINDDIGRILSVRPIEWLSLSATNVSDKIISDLSRTTGIKYLDISHNFRIKGKNILDLFDQNEIEYLNMIGTRIPKPLISTVNETLTFYRTDFTSITQSQAFSTSQIDDFEVISKETVDSGNYTFIPRLM